MDTHSDVKYRYFYGLGPFSYFKDQDLLLWTIVTFYDLITGYWFF